ncbi:MAG: glutaredoxin [Cyclobacteriaceae bacterium]|nr:glutaredoxin [Cyclobacteriaceae bacterium]
MQFHPNELFLIYDPQSNVGRQTKALALDLCSHINEVDVRHEKFSPTYWREVVTMLGMHPNDLLDQSHQDYKKVGANNLTMDGWLNVLTHHGHLVKYPIVIFSQSAVLCKTPTDIVKLKGKPSEKTLPHLKNYR